MSLKLFGKNTVIYAVGNIGLRGASFLLIPIYTYFLSQSDYGLLATLLISIQLMLILANLGMQTCLVRFTKEYEDSDRLGALVGSCAVLNILAGLTLAGVSFALLMPFFRSILHIDDVRLYMGMVCGVVMLESLNTLVMSYYRVQNQALRFSIIGISLAVTLALASFILIRVCNLGTKGALLAYMITYGGGLLFVSLDVLPKTGFGVSLSLMPKLLRFGFPLVFSNTGQTAIGAVGVYLLSYFAGLEAVAIYALGWKLAGLMGVVLTYPFSLAFQPYVFTNLNSADIKARVSRLLTYLVLGITFVSFALLAGARVLLLLIAPPEYASSYLVILLLVPGMAFAAMYYFGGTLITAVQKTYLLGLIVTVGAMISLLLNYTLIPAISWYGAVLALDATHILVGSTLFIMARKMFPIPVEWKRIGIAAILLTSFVFIFLFIRSANLVLFPLLSLLAALVGVLVLFVFQFFHHDERTAIRKLIRGLRRAKARELA
jgi:O-antigen/teichoic acid export membrane protein